MLSYHLTAHIVGREREQDTLRRLLEAVREGHGALAVVSGEAGIGKTTLVRDLSRAAEENGWLIIRGGCYDLTSTPPYGPWIEAFYRSYLPEGELPDLPASMRDEEGLRSLGSQGALFRQIDGFVSSVVARVPLFIILEDLHWVDEASVDLLRFLARQLFGRRLLIVATYRDDEVVRGHPLYAQLPALLRESPVERIALRPLQEDDLARLVEERYTLEHSDRERLVNYLHDRSDGNPFYIGELLQELEERRTLHIEGERWTLDESFQHSLPALLQQTLDLKLDRLDDVHRERLQDAATIGQVVPYDVWKATSGEDDRALEATIAAAVRHSVLIEVSDGTAYEFSHALLRETLYTRVLAPRRRRLHRRIAEVLESTARQGSDEIAYSLLPGAR